MKDTRQTDELNQLAALNALQRFGWLTADMLAVLLWPKQSQSLSWAQSTLAKLLKQNFILRRKISEDVECYLLSAKGARHLSGELGIMVESGRTLVIGNATHRATTNWYTIQKMRQGYKAWTAHEIQRGLAPVIEWHGRAPDTLLERDSGLIWVEVEPDTKNQHKQNSIVRFCERNLSATEKMMELTPDNYLLGFAVVSSNTDAFREMASAFDTEYREGRVSESQLAEIEIALLAVSESLMPGELREGFLWFNVLKPMLERNSNESSASVAT